MEIISQMLNIPEEILCILGEISHVIHEPGQKSTR